jgi:hypothetical protein
MSTTSRVLAFLNGRDCSLEVATHDGISLIRSGLLDSIALFELTLWIEAEIGRPLDPGTLDVVADWDTPADIARFIDARRAEREAQPDLDGPGITKPTALAVAEPHYEIVPYAPHHHDAVTRLHATLIGAPTPAVSARYLAWRYVEHPYTPLHRFYLAVAGDEVVGMRGVYDMCWETDRGPFVVPGLSDLIIAPSHRNRGLYTRIMDALTADLRQAGHTHVFSLSAAPVTSMGALAMGFRAVAPVDALLRKPNRRLRLWRKVRRAFGAFPKDAWIAPRVLGDGLVAESTVRAQAMADLIDRLGHDGRLRHRRDAAYLAWRYRNPRMDYRFMYRGADRLEGYLALSRHVGSPSSRIYIADWEAVTAAVAAKLLDAAIAQCGERDVLAWQLGLDAQRRRLLVERGFGVHGAAPGARGFERFVLVKALTGATTLGGQPVFDANAWDYRMLYSDAC